METVIHQKFNYIIFANLVIAALQWLLVVVVVFFHAALAPCSGSFSA